LNFGARILHIAKIPVADNNRYPKDQYKILYSAESGSIFINQAQMYYRNDSWSLYNFEEMFSIPK